MKAYRNILLILSFAVGAVLVSLSALLQLDGGSGIIVINNDLERDADIDVYHIYLDLNKVNDDDQSEDRIYNSPKTSTMHQKWRSRMNNTGTTKSKLGSVKEKTRTAAWELVSPKQVLEFVHITKTGGTAVEKAGGEAGMTWGICHFSKQVGYGRGCKRPDWVLPFGDALQLRENIGFPHFRGEQWHTPPSWIQNSPYEGRKTFTIVRNPYDRVVSEFYCQFFGYYRPETNPGFLSSSRVQHDAKHHHGKTPINNSPERLEELVEKVFYRPENNDYFDDEGLPDEKERHDEDDPDSGRRRLSEVNKGEPSSMPAPTKLTFNRWIRRAVRDLNPITGHMLPQYYYVYNIVNGTNHQVVDHVLHYEQLHQEFAALMKQYRLRVKLPRFDSPLLDLGGNPRLTAADLDPRTIRYINRRYAQDFEKLGYPLRS